jgi:hypothetical protein
MSATYKIVFTGKLKDNTDISTVTCQLSTLLNIPYRVCEKLFDGKAYALLKDLTSIEAVKKESSLKALGLITKVHPQTTSHTTQPINKAPNAAHTQAPALVPHSYKLVTQPIIINNEKREHKLKKYRAILINSLLYSCYMALLISCIFAAATAFTLFTAPKNDVTNNTHLAYENYKVYLNNQLNRSAQTPYENSSHASYEALQTQQQINDYFTQFSNSINN